MAAKDVATSGLHAEEARRISEELEDPWGVAQSMFLLGDVAANEGRWEDARRLFEQCVERFRTLGDEQHALWAGRMLGWMYSELGERARARSLYEDNLARARSIANEQITAETLEALASLAVADGEPRDAIPLLREAYGIRRGLDDVFRLGVLLIRFAGVLAAEGFGVEAIRCLAGGERLLEESGASPPWVEDMKQQAIERIELDEPSVVSARDEGRKLTADEGLSLALAALSES
jgi:tetratricopeptide (TPR) repeat protein